MPRALALIEQEDILARLGVSRFTLGRFELQVTRYADSAHLWCHRDIGPAHPDRHVSYVYYFHRQPRGFSGGDPLLFDQDGQGARSDSLAFTRIAPADNLLVLFPSDRWHSVSRVTVESSDPRDARWTVIGWFNLPAARSAEASGAA
jgi:Rps23 Pro-64 3,4-dihydroxylase Tpa1-like proline 4-hydroxylase